MTSHFECSSDLSVLQCPNTCPFSSPEGVQFVVVNTNLYGQMLSIIIVLVDVEQGFTLAKCALHIAFHFSDQGVSESTLSLVWRLTNCLSLEGEGVEGESFASNVVVVHEVPGLVVLTSSGRCHEASRLVIDWNMNHMRLIPSLQSCLNFII